MTVMTKATGASKDLKAIQFGDNSHYLTFTIKRF
jgi:hypothetical protein